MKCSMCDLEAGHLSPCAIDGNGKPLSPSMRAELGYPPIVKDDPDPTPVDGHPVE